MSTVKELKVSFKELKDHVESEFVSFSGKFEAFEKRMEDTLTAHTNKVVEDIMKIRSVHIDYLVKSNQALQRKNYELETRVTQVEDRLAKVERQLNQVDQNHRKNNVEISGIPTSVDDESLPASVLRIVNFVTGMDYTIGDIEACHRLAAPFSPKPTIVRMKRNIIDSLKRNSRKLKGAAEALNLPPGCKIFINDNLSPVMRQLSNHARCLKNDGVIEDTWFSNAAVRVKTAGGRVHRITHEMDLIKIAPRYRDFNFDTTFGSRVLYENPDFMDIVRMDRLDGALSADASFDATAIAESVRPIDDAT